MGAGITVRVKGAENEQTVVTNNLKIPRFAGSGNAGFDAQGNLVPMEGGGGGGSSYDYITENVTGGEMSINVGDDAGDQNAYIEVYRNTDVGNEESYIGVVSAGSIEISAAADLSLNAEDVYIGASNSITLQSQDLILQNSSGSNFAAGNLATDGQGKIIVVPEVEPEPLPEMVMLSIRKNFTSTQLRSLDNSTYLQVLPAAGENKLYVLHKIITRYTHSGDSYGITLPFKYRGGSYLNTYDIGTVALGSSSFIDIMTCDTDIPTYTDLTKFLNAEIIIDGVVGSIPETANGTLIVVIEYSIVDLS